jgi:septal ring factor EnvC (AmiA/AmiB activator)
MAALASWPAAFILGLVVAGGVWALTRWMWPKPSAFMAIAAGIAAVLLVHYVGPTVSRWRTIQQIERTQEHVATARTELQAARQEAQAARQEAQKLRERLAIYADKEKAFRARIAALEGKDREHARRRKELDQVVIPAAAPVGSREQAMDVFRRYTR